MGLALALGATICKTIAPEKNCPPVRVRGLLRVIFGVGRQFSSGVTVLELFKLNPLCDNKTTHVKKSFDLFLSCEFRESVKSTYLVKHFDRHKMATKNYYPLSERSVCFALGMTEGD